MNGMRGITLALAALVPAWTASGTWSIVLVDTRTGEVAAASATCLAELDLQALTPVMLAGVGACTAQSFGDTSQVNRTLVRDRLAEGVAPTALLTALAAFDGGSHQTRQYGIVDVQGRTATFTGTGANAWAGGRTGTFQYSYAGRTGTIAYAVQGNILTGAPVVDRAVEAILSTPGDVAARVMAGMEAARVMGGDGRCSCSTGPTSCGSPPPSFTKSSHIAYMLISRPGDADGGHGVYRTPATTTAVYAIDATGDGKPELFATPTTGPNVQAFLNQSPASRVAPTFSSGASVNMGSGAQSIALADVTGDGRPDLLSANLQGNLIGIRPGQSNFTFGAFSSLNTATGPRSIVVAQLDGLHGPDLAYGTQTPPAVAVRLSTGPGTFAPPAEIAFGLVPRHLFARDVDRDGFVDLVVLPTGYDQPVVLRGRGDGTFASPPALATTPTEISAAALDDVDGDGDADLVGVLTGAAPGLRVYINAGGTFTPSPVLLTSSPPFSDVAIGDVQGDGHADVLTVNRTTLFRVYSGDSTGTFAPGPSFNAGWALGRVTLADLDADGDLDAAFNNVSNGYVITAINRGEGRFDSGRGSAFGDYFMSHNVADTSEGDPDPVLTLREMYDAWRVALVGRVDAVQSLVITPSLLPLGESRTIRLMLRDWRALPAPHAGVPMVEVIDGAGRATLGAVTRLGAGVFEIAIRGESSGALRLRITVRDGEDAVRLVPDATLIVGAWCVADVDANGGVTIDDLLAYLAAYGAGDLAADVDDGSRAGQRDAGITPDDLEYFLERFEGGC